MRWRCLYGDFSWLYSCGRSRLFIKRSGVALSGTHFLEFKAGIADPQDAKPTEQCVAFTDNVDLFPVAKEGVLGGAVGHSAVTKEFHVGRQARRGRFYGHL